MNPPQSQPTTDLRNPFIHGRPTNNPIEYIGRQVDVGHAFSLLRNGNSVSIVGERRTGKTSFLRYLAEPVVNGDYGFASQEVVFVYFDCQTLPGATTECDFWNCILGEVQRELSNAHQLSVPIPHLRGDDFSTQIVQIFFQDIAAHTPKIVLLLDEFDHLSNFSNVVRSNILNLLRALANSNYLLLVTATQSNLGKLAKIWVESSHFFNIFTTIHLSYFSLKEHMKLVDTYLALSGSRIRFTKKERTKIGFWTGCHPFLLQMAYWHLYEAYKNKHPRTAKQRLAYLHQELKAQTKPHFEYYWSKSDGDEKLILEQLAAWQQGSDKDNPVRSPMLTQNGSHMQSALESLVDRCLVVEESGEYSIFPPMFAAWMIDKIKNPLKPDRTWFSHFRFYRSSALAILLVSALIILYIVDSNVRLFVASSIANMGRLADFIGHAVDEAKNIGIGILVVAICGVILVVLIFFPKHLSKLSEFLNKVLNS